MIASDFRKEARTKLTGKWGKAACITLAYCFVFFVIGLIEGLFPESIKFIFSIASLVIEVPLIFGVTNSLIKLYNGEDVKAFSFFSLGFNNFKKSWSVTFNTILKMIVPVILIIISYVLIAVGIVSSVMFAITTTNSSIPAIVTPIGFILLIISMIWAITKSYYYQLSTIIAIDNPEMTGKEAVLRSEELMKNKRGKLFCLQISFIGWAILSAFTFGIGYLWLMPYIQFAIISFYKNSLESTSEVTQ